MYKSVWCRVLICLSVIVVLTLSVLPVLSHADTWDEVNPSYGLEFGQYYSNLTQEYFTEHAISAVEKAYKLGLFGGCRPVYIFYDFFNDTNGGYVRAITPTAKERGFMSETGTKRWLYQLSAVTGSDTEFGMIDTITYSNRAPFVVWTLQYNGDWYASELYQPAENITFSTTPIGTGGESSIVRKRVARYDPTTDSWIKPTGNMSTVAGWDGGSADLSTLPTIITKYNEQIALLNQEPIIESISYNLDIVGIFDGIFSGASSIMGAFNIELFGINIIGTLVAITVITIVAFVVRRLWK